MRPGQDRRGCEPGQNRDNYRPGKQHRLASGCYKTTCEPCLFGCGEDRIVLGRFSQLYKATQFATKTVSVPRLAALWLVLLIWGCFGLFGSCSSTVLAQSIPATLSGGVLLPTFVFAAAVVATAIATATSTDGGASYCRFSSKNQDERTIADQQRRCRERAARDDYSPDGLLDFADEAVSGAAPSRAGFDEMMTAARAGRIKVLYFVNLSRLARDCLLTLQTMRELVYLHKVRVVSIDEGIDTAQTDSWELLAAILGIQHEQFLKKLAIDVFGGQEGVVLDHYCVGDFCFGFSSEAGSRHRRQGQRPQQAAKDQVHHRSGMRSSGSSRSFTGSRSNAARCAGSHVS